MLSGLGQANADMSLGRSRETIDVLNRYLEAGGGVLMLGAFGQMATVKPPQDAFLKPLGLTPLFDELPDDPKTAVTSTAWELPFALTGNIAESPLGAGVKSFWYPVPRTRVGGQNHTIPFVAGPSWQMVVRGSASSLTSKGALQESRPDQPGTYREKIPLLAVRSVGKGRIIYFGITPEYLLGPNANSTLEGIVLDKGLNGTPSDGFGTSFPYPDAKFLTPDGKSFRSRDAELNARQPYIPGQLAMTTLDYAYSISSFKLTAGNYLFKQGAAPFADFFSDYDAMGVVTARNGEVVEDASEDYLKLCASGQTPVPLVIDLMDEPGQLGKSRWRTILTLPERGGGIIGGTLRPERRVRDYFDIWHTYPDNPVVTEARRLLITRDVMIGDGLREYCFADHVPVHNVWHTLWRTQPVREYSVNRRNHFFQLDPDSPLAVFLWQIDIAMKEDLPNRGFEVATLQSRRARAWAVRTDARPLARWTVGSAGAGGRARLQPLRIELLRGLPGLAAGRGGPVPLDGWTHYANQPSQTRRRATHRSRRNGAAEERRSQTGELADPRRSPALRAHGELAAFQRGRRAFLSRLRSGRRKGRLYGAPGPGNRSFPALCPLH